MVYMLWSEVEGCILGSSGHFGQFWLNLWKRQQICPECPELPKLHNLPNMSRIVQSGQICPDLPKLPRLAQNAQNAPICPECPYLPRIPVSVSTQNAKKRSATLLSPSNLAPLAQRIRSDIGIAECEVESPDRELLRSQLCPENTPPPCSPCVKGFPLPAPLVFTPCKIQEVAEISGSNVKVPPLTVFKCLNCDGPMGASHQCGDFSSPKETVMQNTSRIIRNLKKFCSVCETFHKADTKCRSCATPEPPPKTVKCHVCACLGRETSLVQCGSVCPSCGVTAIASWTGGKTSNSRISVQLFPLPWGFFSVLLYSSSRLYRAAK